MVYNRTSLISSVLDFVFSIGSEDLNLVTKIDCVGNVLIFACDLVFNFLNPFYLDSYFVSVATVYSDPSQEHYSDGEIVPIYLDLCKICSFVYGALVDAINFVAYCIETVAAIYEVTKEKVISLVSSVVTRDFPSWCSDSAVSWSVALTTDNFVCRSETFSSEVSARYLNSFVSITVLSFAYGNSKKILLSIYRKESCDEQVCKKGIGEQEHFYFNNLETVGSEKSVLRSVTFILSIISGGCFIVAVNFIKDISRLTVMERCVGSDGDTSFPIGNLAIVD